MTTNGPFKDRLITALHSAVGYFNQDNDPNAAVVKAARDADFNVDQTTRLVEMFNTARTLYHYKNASDRTAAFTLAASDEVLPMLFAVPVTVAEKSAEADYSAYDQREQSYHEADHMAKAAASIHAPVDASLSMQTVADQAMRALRSMRQTAKIAEDEARIAGHNAARTFQKLASLFAYGADRRVLEDRYARLVVGHQDGEWQPVIVKLGEFMPAHNKAPEAMLTKYARVYVIDDRDLHPHLELMKEARDWMQAEAEMLAASSQFTKEADDFEREYLVELSSFFPLPAAPGLASFIRPELIKAASGGGGGKPGVGPKDKPEKDKPNRWGTTEPYGLDIIPSALSDGMKPPSGSINVAVERAFTEPIARSNKALSERLKNVQRSIMLQDLMVNDPVLSEEAPEAVAQAYSAMLQLAPEMAGSKEVARAVLRQMVHSVAVSPYDADVWTKLEGNIRNLRGNGATMHTPQQSAGGGKR
jgi:hypothetical protein